MADAKQIERIAKGVSPLVKQIIALLLEEIDALQNGEALMPEIELAEKFGISRKTIRVAMKRLTEEGMIRRIKGKGTFPTQGPHCRPLFRKGVKRVGLVSYGGGFSSTDNFYSKILQGVMGKSVENNCQVLFAGGREPAEVADSCFRLAAEKNVDGIILIAFTDQQLLSDLAKWKKPISLIDHYTDTKGIDCIRADSSKGSQIAIEHLHRLGHRKIAYGNTGNKATNPARLKGYLEALKTWKLEQKDEWIFTTARGSNEGEDVAMQFLALPTENRPTALVAFSDTMAKNAEKVFTRFGLKLPADLSLIGTGGIPLSGKREPQRISNVCFDWEKLGQLGCENILKRIEDPKLKTQNILLAPSLDMGTSTAPPLASHF
jgi:DNA-binding LacI/PurR family transcriptional regulator